MKNFKHLLAVSALILMGMPAFAQLKVGTNPTSINGNAVFEMESTNRGMLLPRLALTGTTDAAPLTAFVEGMTIYNTATAGDVTPGIYYCDGTKWVKAGAGVPVNLYTADGTVGANRRVGITDSLTFTNGSNNLIQFRRDSSIRISGTIRLVDTRNGGRFSINSEQNRALVSQGMSNGIRSVNAVTGGPSGSSVQALESIGRLSNSSGSFDNVYGGDIAADFSGSSSATLSNAVGVNARVFTSFHSGAQLTNAIGVRSRFTSFGSSTQNVYAFYSTGVDGFGSNPINYYGLYLSEGKGTNKFGVYQAGASDQNYFAGRTGIATTAPTSTFHAQGSVSMKVAATSASITLGDDYTYLVNATAGAVTLTLPAATAAEGRMYTIRKTDETSNLVNFSEPIKVSETTSITSLNYLKTIRIQAAGGSWWLID